MDQLKIEMCDINRITPYARNRDRNDEAQHPKRRNTGSKQLDS